MGDRRPIAARTLPPVVALSGWLVRHGASANGISVAGMGAGCLAGIALAYAPGSAALWLLGAALVQLRLLANMLDGMVAIGRGTASPVGELFNEVPDRVADTAVLIGLGVAAGSVAWGMAAAMAAMATAYVRAVGFGLGQPSDFGGPMAKQHRMAVVTGAALLCAVWPAQQGLVPLLALYGITALAVVTALRRLANVARGLRARELRAPELRT